MWVNLAFLALVRARVRSKLHGLLAQGRLLPAIDLRCTGTLVS